MVDIISKIKKFLKENYNTERAVKENKGKMSGLTFREGSRKLPAKFKDSL